MIFVRKAFDFIGKHAALIIPMFILSLVPQALAFWITGSFPSDVLTRLQTMVTDYFSSPNVGTAADAIIGALSKMITDNFPNFGTMIGILLISTLVLRIFIVPGVYASITRGLSDEPLSVRSAAPLFVRDMKKYVIYLVCLALYWFFWAFCAAMIFLFAFTFSFILQSAFAVLITLAVIFIIACVIYLNLVIVLWYPAMSLEELGVEAALRKGIKVARRFMPLILLTYAVSYGLYLLIMFGFASITSSTTGLEIASVILSVLMTFFLMVFQMILYKTYVDIEKTAYAKMIAEEEAEKAAKAEKEKNTPPE